jgi:tetratricopeptide (TPR) repeat protein
MKQSLITLGFAAALISGCSALDTPTFQNNYSLYNREALKAEKEGNWDAAAKRYFLALQNSEWANEGKGVRADFHYKLGRALGATCQFEKSEQNLSQANELNPRMPQALAELGRLKLSQDKLADALSYFERALPGLEKSASSDPIGVAEIFDDYSSALNKSSKAADATGITKRAETLRAANSGKSAAMIKPPYGGQCPEKKS